MNRSALLFLVAIAVGVLGSDRIFAQTVSPPTRRTITDRQITWPTREQWQRVVLLRDYNSRVVIVGTMLLGSAAGLVGSFTLLRKRALLGDALSHATFPGIYLAFMIATALGGDGKSLPLLLAGATCSGLLGVGSILLIRNLTRIKEDAALGIVLSVFFAAGVALWGIGQQMKTGHAAGLEAFIYGKTASMGIRDAQIIGTAALLCLVACGALFKEFKLLCFDEGFAASRGFRVAWLDMILMALVVTVSIVGLQAVGLVLVVALLVIPAAAARFWTESMWKMALIASVLGAVSGIVGAAISALFSKLPSGAMIVLVCSACFLVSLVCGTARGVLVRTWRRIRLNRSIDRQHLLRAVYEILDNSRNTPESVDPPADGVPFQDLLAKRSWSAHRLARELRRAQRAGLVHTSPTNQISLTTTGVTKARRLTRQHRLWELYLITHADVAPSRVDRDADAIEHVLETDVVQELERLLEYQRGSTLPANPHAQVGPDASPSPGEQGTSSCP